MAPRTKGRPQGLQTTRTQPTRTTISIPNVLVPRTGRRVTAIQITGTEEDPIARAEEDLRDAIDEINDALEEVRSSSEPGISVDGITLNDVSSPVTADAQTTSATLSIVQDPADTMIKRKIMDRVMGPQPVILSSVRLPELTVSEMDDAIEVGQFEKQVVKEAMLKGIEVLADQDPGGLFTASEEATKEDLKEVDDQLSAISDLVTSARLSATGLNITALSDQIMQRASDSMAPMVFQSERGNDPLPVSVDEYLALTFPRKTDILGVDEYLTNTTRIVVLGQDMLVACLSAHPTSLTYFSRGRMTQAALFAVPGQFGYDPDGSSDLVTIPTVTDLFTRSDRSIVNQFSRTRGASSTGGVSPVREVRGVLNNNNIDTAEEAWDTISHLITCLSNEMILSAGIGRLQGSQLGNRFLERRPDNPSQFSPFNRVLGFSPTSGAEEISRFFQTGPDREIRNASLLDFLALGEETQNREFVVMPFEPNTVVFNGIPYVSGKQYFIDLAMQSTESPEIRESIRRFSRQYSEFTTDMVSYVTQIMMLDKDTKLAPQVLFARVVQDIGSVLSGLDRSEDQVDYKSALVAAIVSYAGENPTRTLFATNSRGGRQSVSASDVIKMSVIAALKDFDSLSDDVTFKMSGTATEYIEEETSAEKNLRTAVLDFTSIVPNKDRKAREGVLAAKYDLDENELLHDISFASETNLISLIARTVREVQKEALNLAQEGGAKSDYRNTGGGSLMSDCDDDRLVDVITEIYMRLAYLMFPTRLVRTRARRGSRYRLEVEYERALSAKSVALLSDLRGSLINGSAITQESIFETTLLDATTPLSNEEKTISTVVANVVNSAARMFRHRYYIKGSLKILESIASATSAASSRITDKFDILNGSVRKKDLKGSDLKLYEMFVENSDRFDPLLEVLDSQQANIVAASRSLHTSPEKIFVRRDIDTTTAERLALRDFIRTVYDQGSLDDLFLVSVGLPRGLIDSVYSPAFEVEESDVSLLASQGTEGEGGRQARTVRIEVDRFDGAYDSSTANAEVDILGTSPSPSEFDPEIFILPDSIAYDPWNRSNGSLGVMDEIFRTTTFYRIRDGKVIESVQGDRVPPGQVRTHANALKSYLLDLYLYETARIRYIDGMSPPGVPVLSGPAVDLTKAVGANPALSRVVLNRARFDRLFDSGGSLRSGFDLNKLLTPRSVTQRAEFNMSDVRMAALYASTSTLSSKEGIVVPRPYDRVFHFLYDETVARNRVTGDSLDRKRQRAQFDIYTLAVRLTYGGGQ